MTFQFITYEPVSRISMSEDGEFFNAANSRWSSDTTHTSEENEKRKEVSLRAVTSELCSGGEGSPRPVQTLHYWVKVGTKYTFLSNLSEYAYRPEADELIQCLEIKFQEIIHIVANFRKLDHLSPMWQVGMHNMYKYPKHWLPHQYSRRKFVRFFYNSRKCLWYRLLWCVFV